MKNILIYGLLNISEEEMKNHKNGSKPLKIIKGKKEMLIRKTSVVDNVTLSKDWMLSIEPRGYRFEVV